jgi:predicted transcriptional regulator
MATRTKRSTELNMTPVAGVHPTVVALFKRCERAGLSMRQLCLLAGVHHDVPARWRRGDSQPTVRLMQKLLDTLGEQRRVRR